jgi:aminoglycoside phosphotransferase (APT) family kinase protein
MLIDGRIMEILALIGRVTDRVELIKQGNHVFRLVSGGESFFLKTYTKGWYGSDPASTGFHAIHETMAWRILSKYGLSVPEVVYSSSDCSNPLARPFILTRELAGRPLTHWLTGADREEQSNLLIAVGNYLKRMHEITFEFPGYLSTLSGPTEPPDPNGWQHRCWSAQVREAGAANQLQSEQHQLAPEIYAEARQICWQISARLANAYQPPRFTHGDCHAHQFFLTRQESSWQVTGVVDMEVSSAGDCGEDLVKICIELAQRFDYDTAWWKWLFAGYGSVPDLEAFRLRLLGVAPLEYGNTGKWIRTQDREKILQRILYTREWDALFVPIE